VERLARVRAIARVALTGFRALDTDRLRLRAMALTYLSLFALVPALVVAFSIVQAFTGMAAIWGRVDEFLIDNLAVGARNTIAPYLERFVKNAHAGSAGVVGGTLLAWSAISLFRNVEGAVNDIWHVRRGRPVRQLVLTYWAGLTLGPILLASSLTLGHAVRAVVGSWPLGQYLASLGAFVLACGFFWILYLIVPATKVRPRAALVGGVVAALAFEVAKAAYTYVVAKFFKYDRVYGSVAAIPIFLVWLHLSWTIMLLGARVAFVAQHVRVLLRAHVPEVSPRGRERLAAQAMLEVARAFRRGEAPPLAEEVAVRVEALPEPVHEVLIALRQAGLVVEAASGGLLPARPLSHITLADIRQVVAGDAPTAEGSGPAQAVVPPLAAAEGAAVERLAAVSFEDLCAGVGASTRALAEPAASAGEVAPAAAR
jgi:membrane protein